MVDKIKIVSIIREVIQEELKENPLDPMDTEGHINQAKIEWVLKELNRKSWKNLRAPEGSEQQSSDVVYAMGYQKALKDAAEELLGFIF